MLVLFTSGTTQFCSFFLSFFFFSFPVFFFFFCLLFFVFLFLLLFVSRSVGTIIIMYSGFLNVSLFAERARPHMPLIVALDVLLLTFQVGWKFVQNCRREALVKGLVQPDISNVGRLIYITIIRINIFYFISLVS